VDAFWADLKQKTQGGGAEGAKPQAAGAAASPAASPVTTPAAAPGTP